MIELGSTWEGKNRLRALLISAAIILVVAVVDWRTKPYVSLGFLYLFPIMLAAGFLSRPVIALLGLACAALSAEFSSLELSPVRIAFETLALSGCGLFVGELVRNRRQSVEAEERLRILVETSPAAIVTVNDQGFIELANRAASELLAPRDGCLTGNPIAAFLPELHHALRLEEGPQFRASMQCRAHQGNGEPFNAHVWFSTYKEAAKPKLAAIIAPAPEETNPHVMRCSSDPMNRIPLNSRETEVIRLVVQGLGNKEIAAKMEISESSVKNVLQQLFAKSEVRTRAQLVRVAMEEYRNLL
jgi:DNA-binding CsgD family transcriptional regulator